MRESVLLKLPTRKKKKGGFFAQYGNVTYGFSRHRRFWKDFLLQKFGFCTLHKKETDLTWLLLQEPFETSHALGFWPDLLSTAGKHFQHVAARFQHEQIFCASFWTKRVLPLILTLLKQYSLISAYFLCYPFSTEDISSGINLKWKNGMYTLKIPVI